LAEFTRPFDLLECVNCGLCLEVCPTYDLRRDEASGPRGRIRLMEALGRDEEGRASWVHHLDECVGCLACQARCPAGAPFGGMLDHARERLAATRGEGSRLGRWALENLVTRPDRLRKWRWALRLFTWLRLHRGLRLLRLHRLPGLSWMRGLAWLPSVGRRKTPPSPRAEPSFLYFPGCVGGLLFPDEEAASLTLLERAGGYALPDDWTCCGAVHRHLGDLEGACGLARRNIEALEGELPVVTEAAGCGAALKEYGDWLADDPDWADRAREFSARVRDLGEVLTPDLFEGASLPATRRVAYDDPCHAVHVQGIAAEPRALLDAVGNLERVELPHADRCCGAGGTYFLRQPELSRGMIESRLADFDATGADVLLTANTGCRLQWEASLSARRGSARVMHPAELLAEAVRGAESEGDSV